MPPFDKNAVDIRIAAAVASRRDRERYYAENVLRACDVGHRTGPVHAASLLVWNIIADRAGVPRIGHEVVTVLPMDLVEKVLDERHAEIDGKDRALLAAATAHCTEGTFWRTEFCASGRLKGAIAQTGSYTTEDAEFDLEDPRIADIHYGLTEITILGRPTVDPVRVNEWPVEFRVFIDGRRQDPMPAVSFRHPQAGAFEPTVEMAEAMEWAAVLGARLHAERDHLGLIPWLPGREPDTGMGAAIDFILTQDQGLLLGDAGPGHGHGAHPCCFDEDDAIGRRWWPGTRATRT